MNKLLTISIAIILLICSISAFPSGNFGLTFYRGPDGTITQQSSDNAKAMEVLAKANGHIDVWLTLNYAFNLYTDQMTAEEIASQDAEVAVGFNNVLASIVAKGDAKHPRAGPLIKGPGCAVRVTKNGLKILLKDDRIIQIVAMNME